MGELLCGVLLCKKDEIRSSARPRAIDAWAILGVLVTTPAKFFASDPLTRARNALYTDCKPIAMNKEELEASRAAETPALNAVTNEKEAAAKKDDKSAATAPSLPPPPTSDNPVAAASSSSSSQASLGKRPRDWFGAGGDGKSAAAGVAAKLQAVETASKLSSIKGKLSKPKLGGAAPSESARKTALTQAELRESQEAHRAKLEANGKAVPHYRKTTDKN